MIKCRTKYYHMIMAILSSFTLIYYQFKLYMRISLTDLILVAVLLLVSTLTACPNNCAICYQGACYKCEDGYELRNTQSCIPICSQYCTNCISPGNCSNCSSIAQLNPLTNSCQLNCSTITTFLGRCKACSNLFYCNQCIDGFELSNSSRFCSIKQNCGPNCLQCVASNSNTTCTLCKAGYEISTVVSNGSSSTCVRDICNISYCSVCSTVSTCSVCSKNYQLANGSTACTPSCTFSFCFICKNASNCESCNVGYALVNGKCSALCSIANCSVCFSESTCLRCSSGYALSTYGKSCEISCNVKNCLQCLNTTSCSTCNLGYNISGGSCLRFCLPGWAPKIQGSCVKCKDITNCSSCFVSSSDQFTCIQCQVGYYISDAPFTNGEITSINSCSPCNLTNCLTCKNASYCSACSFGNKLDSNGSCISNCSATHCEVCSADDSTLCSSCSPGFTLQNGTCTAVCSAGKFVINGVCVCPIRSFEGGSASSCAPCTDYSCINCTAGICSSCEEGYYNSGGECLSCMQDCLSCTASSTCSECRANYIYFNGSCSYLANGFSGVSSSVTTVFTCPAGCSLCTLGVNSLLDCTKVLPGYSIYGTQIIKCAEQCLSCSEPSICLSCYVGFVLVGQKCISCADSKASSCSSTDTNFSLTCLSGYTVAYNGSVGQCQSCGSNCQKCDLNGAGNCDPGQCYLGYVQLIGTKNCTLCFNNCPICDENDPSICISCGLRRFKNYKGLCLGCLEYCKECTSAKICTNCFQGFILTNNVCQASPQWPCAIGTNQTCTLCVQEFTLTKGKCVYNSSCNKTSSCKNCVYGYYYAITADSFEYCLQCPNISSITNCLTCDQSNQTKCFLCNDGYYVQSGNCYSCPQGCKQCSSKYYCLQSKSGYYLVTDSDGSYNGKTGQCSSPCLTCQFSPNYCLSCITGYVINGSVCFNSKIIYYQITFVYGPVFQLNDSFSVAYGKLINSIGSFKQLICSNLPQKVTQNDSSCERCFNFLRFKSGSVNLMLQITAANYQNLNEATADINSKTLIPNATVFSTSTTSEGIYNSDGGASYQYKNALIMAICIPLGFLILLILFAIYYYLKKKRSTEFKYEVKEKKRNKRQNVQLSKIEIKL